MSAVNIPPDIAPLLDRPVAVLGLGVSGQALLGMLERIGADAIAYDQHEGGDAVRRTFDAAAAREHKLVVYSPGFPPTHQWLRAARTNGCAVMGEMEFAGRFCPGPVVAVTGSNGKTTLVEFLTFAMKRVGRDAVAVGNIGYSLSRVAGSPLHEGLTAVCEISSFQAESIELFRPQALIWINFYDNHLDRYLTRKDYFAAKWRLVERLGGQTLIVGPTVEAAAAEFGYTLPDCAQVIRPDTYQPWEMPPQSAFHPRKQNENLMLVRRWWERAGYPAEALRQAAEQFTVREHRMKRLQKVGDVTYWNDSKSTNFAACLGALENFDEPVLWIGGGKNREQPLEPLAAAIAPRVRHAFLIGETALPLATHLRALGVTVLTCDTVQDAVRAAHLVAHRGDHVLFSPGFSSQDFFKSYVERGTAFENAVLGLRGSGTGR